MSATFIQLHPHDNVLIALTRLPAGTPCPAAGPDCVLATDIPFGHKVALRPIVPGEAVVKYGVPIGLATAPIAPGAHVHLHNLRSGYPLADES